MEDSLFPTFPPSPPHYIFILICKRHNHTMAHLESNFLISFLLLLVLALTSLSMFEASSITLTISHAANYPSSSGDIKTWEAALFAMAARDSARIMYLMASMKAQVKEKKTAVPIASGRQITQTANYIVQASVGTPPQPLLMAMDTSNDAAWVPCSGCVGCSSSLFNTLNSTAYQTVPCTATECKQVPNPTCNASATPTSTCTFNLTYGSSSFEANLSRDTLTLSNDTIPSYAFACLQRVAGSSIPPQGLLGLGRGPFSLLSQTDSLYHSTFSYCLPSVRSANFSGSLRLGLAGQPVRIRFTPLLRNPRRPSLYYANLTGIRVGRRYVNVSAAALAFDPATGGGTVIDSGTVFTRLVAPAYAALRDEFRRRVKGGAVTSLGGFDTCYAAPVATPAVTFEFAGGLNVTLPPDNVLIRSSSGGVACLAMASAPDNVNSVVNVIANWQQQNHRVLMDLPNSRIGIARETCTT